MGTADDKVKAADERRRKIRAGVNKLKARKDALYTERRDIEVEIGAYRQDCGTDILKLLKDNEEREAEIAQFKTDLRTMQDAVGVK